MNNKDKDFYIKFVAIIIIVLAFLFGAFIQSIIYQKFENEKSTIYTSCFDNELEKHIVSYKVSSYKVKEELNNPSIDIYCPKI